MWRLLTVATAVLWCSPWLPPAAGAAEAGAYHGCFKTSGADQCLDGRAYSKWDRMDHQTPAWCVARCGSDGFQYAGWQSNWCFCGNNPAKYGPAVDDSLCATRLAGPVAADDPGNPPATAGGPDTMSVYAVRGTPSPTGQSSGPTALGSVWREAESGWSGVWTRRGGSDVFDAVWSYGTSRITAVLTIRVQGNTVTVFRRQASDGNDCDYTGQLSPDRRSVTGTYSCTRYPGPYPWQATIDGAAPPRQARTFERPALGQVRLDWCREWATNCGDPAAQAFCRAAGYSRATAFDGPDLAPNVTQTIGSGQVCRGDYCGSFYSITCG